MTFDEIFFMEKIDFYNVGMRRIDEYMIDGKYRLLNFDHLVLDLQHHLKELKSVR